MTLFRSIVASLLIAAFADVAISQTRPSFDASTKPIRIDRVIDAHENAIAQLRSACKTQACEQVAAAGDKMVADARLKRANKTMTAEEAHAYVAASKKHIAEMTKALLNNAEGTSSLDRRRLLLSRWSAASSSAGRNSLRHL
jgi:hypothetical protein